MRNFNQGPQQPFSTNAAKHHFMQMHAECHSATAFQSQQQAGLTTGVGII